MIQVHYFQKTHKILASVHEFILGPLLANLDLKGYPSGNKHIPYQDTFEDGFPFTQVGYVSSLEGKIPVVCFFFFPCYLPLIFPNDLTFLDVPLEVSKRLGLVSGLFHPSKYSIYK